jgi:N-acetylglucosamine-6-phosphate deacetylase
MRYACCNGDLLLEDGLRSGMALIVENGDIGDVVPVDQIGEDLPLVDLGGHRLIPGLVDLQVNGGNGVLFNDDPSVASLRRIAEAHWQYGTTAFLPTLISDDLEKVKVAIKAVGDAIAAGVPGIVGIHIEGPFLNIDRSGIHDRMKIRPFDREGLEAISAVAGGRTLITVAPECLRREDIQELLDRDILICAGHTNATYAQLAEAFDAGVSGVTHLFNAMSQLTNREPGAVGAALNNPDSWCCLIVDGKHVHPATLQIALKAKGGHERLILVTDAMPTVGLENKTFQLFGEDVAVVDGVCQDRFGTLAGSDIDMAQSVLNAQNLMGTTFAQAVEMGSANPARFLGMQDRFGTLTAGKKANMVRLDESGRVHTTWIEGQVAWTRQP